MGEIIVARRTESVFLLDDTKNGDPRHVPVHPKIRACLKVRMREQSKMGRYFRKAREKVGMDWLHFHDLRHSAASEMINAPGRFVYCRCRFGA
jgi:integrase